VIELMQTENKIIATTVRIKWDLRLYFLLLKKNDCKFFPVLKPVQKEKIKAIIRIDQKSGIVFKSNCEPKEKRLFRYTLIEYMFSNLNMTHPIITMKNVHNVERIVPVFFKRSIRKIRSSIKNKP
tara:strand:+ start:1564 stop:1938 length:375 start_codon:yes stop_codon:yes gene_type:complete